MGGNGGAVARRRLSFSTSPVYGEEEGPKRRRHEPDESGAAAAASTTSSINWSKCWRLKIIFPAGLTRDAAEQLNHAVRPPPGSAWGRFYLFNEGMHQLDVQPNWIMQSGTGGSGGGEYNGEDLKIIVDVCRAAGVRVAGEAWAYGYRQWWVKPPTVAGAEAEVVDVDQFVLKIE